jgi:beta-glucosidase
LETRAAGIPWSFSPVLDIGRQPLWPRFYETFGEDPYLATVMGVAFVRGLEGEDLSANTSVASSLKHYVGYSQPLNGRDRTPAWIPENYLREFFLPTFAAAVKAGARTVMVNSAEVNGVPGHVNRHLLIDVLRGELGFKGLVVSDWQDIKKLVTQWKVAADEREATRLSVMAGIDMSMVPNDYSFADHLVALVKEGSVPMSRIDEAVRRILLVKFELGLFERPGPDASLKGNVGQNSSRDVALQAARESLVLLKNEGGLLPLARDRRVLVTGPTANSLISLNNGWTYVWQGSEESLYPKDRPTILQALEGKFGANLRYEPGTRITRPPGSPSGGTPTDRDEEVDIPAAVRAARDADVVVLCLGEGSYTETPGNITDLNLPDVQLRLAEAIQATGKPVVLVLVEGRPRVINRIAEKSAAILLALNPGNEGGVAVADVLVGDYNPGGRLPFTYPRTPNGLVTYDHKLFETEATSFGNMAFNPQFAFGHGLSYTTYAYSDLRLERKQVPWGGAVRVSVTVRNAGRRAGKETVILYVRDVVASLAPPGRRVRRFAKVYLEPGESRVLTFTLRPEDLSFVGADNRTVVEPGDFDVLVGGLTERFTLQPGAAPARRAPRPGRR